MNVLSTHEKPYNPVPRARILYYSEGWGFGGIETFIMNAAKVSVQNGYSFDIFCTHDSSDAHDSAIHTLGGERFTVFHETKPNLVKRLYRSIIEWKRLLKTGKYSIVHINTMNGLGFLYAHVAKKLGIPLRIIHSHNTDFGHGARVLKSIVHQASKMFWSSDSTERLACSNAAGKFLFGSNEYSVLPNAIDTEKFRFNGLRRESFRKSLGLKPEEIIFGYVGRFVAQKNPMYMLEIFSQMHRNLKGKTKLILAGQGELKEKMKATVEKLKIQEEVIWLDNVVDMPSVFDGIDILLMPSKYEGLPMTLVEAQTSGVNCLVSEDISEEAYLTDLVRPLSIKSPTSSWTGPISEVIASLQLESSVSHSRARYAAKVRDSGYDINDQAASLERIYQEGLRVLPNTI